MIKRQWPSVIFIIAFVISLAHASIPHSHPALGKHKERHPHNHSSTSKHKHDHSDNHSHDTNENSEDSRPVFAHFSNGDYVGNPYFQFHAKENLVFEFLQPASLNAEVALVFEKSHLFPKARDLPSGRHRSSESLRAPPPLS